MKFHRIRTSRRYKKIFERGFCCRGSHYEIRILKYAKDSNSKRFFSLGVICGKRVGPSVVRHLVKRRARSAIYNLVKEYDDKILFNLDIVCVCLQSAGTANWETIYQDLHKSINYIMNKCILKTNSTQIRYKIRKA